MFRRKTDCLAITHPPLAKQWHPTKNGTLTAYDVVAGTHRKVWWKCERGHEWEATPNNRSKKYRPTPCPGCAIYEKSLGLLRADLAKEWHPTKNSITPYEIAAKSGKKVWWKCHVADDHEYEAPLCNRMKGTGCPFCSNNKATTSNCLATTHPHLVEEWHTDNELFPTQVVAGSTKRILWQCKKNPDHVWKARVCNRVFGGRSGTGAGCHYCKSSAGETKIAELLRELEMPFEPEWSTPECKCKAELRFDFAIQEGKEVLGLIEYQGIQHFEPVSFGSGDDPHEKLRETRKHDRIKRKFCSTKKLPLLAVTYKQHDSLESRVREFVIRL